MEGLAKIVLVHITLLVPSPVQGYAIAMTMTAPAPDDHIAKRNVLILVLAQAFLGAQMPMIFIVGGLAGQSLATNPCLATLPISLIVAGSMQIGRAHV